MSHSLHDAVLLSISLLANGDAVLARNIREDMLIGMNSGKRRNDEHLVTAFAQSIRHFLHEMR